ncbi:MAG: prolyl oligopeptidase family serine peptidase, partial [Candidatus Hydrogenedentes bacterium]|nr:prolyl oligopeptidase family serine peptidase [Candidatus Hydrogenedentota bacterium]
AAMLAATAPADGPAGKGGLDTYCSAVRAVVAVCAPLDLRRPLSLALSNEDDPLVVRFLGGSLAEKLDAARRASPINYIRKETPPIFLLHGKADKRVDMSQSIAMSEALKNAGAIHRLELIEDGKHGMDFARDEKTFQDILAFFDEHLKQGAP